MKFADIILQTTPYSRVTYSITVEGGDNSLFSIVSTSGVLSTTSQLYNDNGLSYRVCL